MGLRVVLLDGKDGLEVGDGMLWGVELCVEFRTVDEKVGDVGV